MSRYDFQRSCVTKIVRLLNQGKRVLFWLDTGGGKTHVAVEVILRELAKGGRVVFVAYGRELIKQASKRLIEAGVPEYDIGLMMGHESHGLDRPVIVASVSTLARRELPKASLVVFDEAHHIAARSWARIAEHYRKRRARILGLTATPYRRDGRALGRAFDEIVRGPLMNDLFAAGTLAKPRIFSVDPGSEQAEMRNVRVIGGDYDPNVAARVMSGKALIGSIVSEYQKRGAKFPAVLYGCNPEHALKLGARLKRLTGCKVTHVDYTTPDDIRDDINSDLESGRVDVVTNYGILAEGWDCPAAKVCIMARPTKSKALWRQIVGRFLRPHKGRTPIILDFAGNIWRFGLPWDEEEVTLDDGAMPTGDPPLRHCSKCNAINPLRATECEECGSTLGATRAERREKEEEAGRLAEVQETEERKRAQRESIASRAESNPTIRKLSAAKRVAWLGRVYQTMGL
jgi:DNA repair protein RadD